MNLQLSNRIQQVKPSPTLAVTARAAQLRQQGKDVIGLGAGEPDFDTPEHIKQAAIAAIHAGQTKYTSVDGTPELRQAVADKFLRENKLNYELDEILVSCGGKQSFYNLCQAYLNPGDEVLIPAPYWVSYPDIVLLADAKPVILSCPESTRFKVQPEQLKQAITPNTRMLVINSPSNPTGMAYTSAELTQLAEILLEHPHILIATDDMYEHILWSTKYFVNIVNVCPDLYHRTVVLNGVSKAYSMTGWRIGYAGGPATLIKAMKKIQSQSTSNPSSISQAAAQAALNGDQSCIQEMLQAFKTRHDYVVSAMNNIPGIQCLNADGTFYCFANMNNLITALPNINNDVELAEDFINRAGVAMVPGSAFGAPGFMRLSFATSLEILQDASTRIAEYVQNSNI